MNMPEGVSVIICCYNSENRIRTTLQHLQKQKFSKPISWEVIVVDNASTDRTAETAAQQWECNPVCSLVVVAEAKPGLMNARYRGLATARYSIVSFIDDDNWTEERWVEKVYTILTADERIGACGGRVLPAFEKHPPEWFSEFENSFAVGQQMTGSGIIDKKGFLWGAGLSFRLSIWMELQRRQFRNITVGREGKSLAAGEDSELCYAIRLLGYSLYYDNDLLLHHYMPSGRLTWQYLERMTIGFGKANVRLNYYRTLLSERLVLRHWTVEWLYAVKEYSKKYMAALFVKSNKEKRRKKMLACYYKGVAAQVWTDKGRSQEMIAELLDVFPVAAPSRPGVQHVSQPPLN